ncbi:MAG TPA: NAD-dependent epimerase/dehydratase family protein [Anaerolineae bacterium]|nr:NAD-dependent epimerase/dehydratase family protein [Anaerolineae bacterium]
MKRVVITGGTGFVGANLARRMLQDGYEVHLVVRPTFDSWRIEDIRESVHLHLVNLLDADSVNSIFQKIQPQWVFHLAAHGAYSWQTNMQPMLETNLIATINLVQAALKADVETFVHTGSSSEYGVKDHAPAESDSLEPNSLYAVTKASASLYCRYIGQSQTFPLITLRLYSVYGPYEEPARLIPTLLVSSLNGQLPPLAQPDIARDFVYIDDVVNAYLIVASQAHHLEPGAIYNVGSGIQTTLRQVVEIAREIFSIQAEPRWGAMPNRGWDTKHWTADNRKIKRELGWQPRVSLKQGLEQTTKWFRDNPQILNWYQQHLTRPVAVAS